LEKQIQFVNVTLYLILAALVLCPARALYCYPSVMELVKCEGLTRFWHYGM